MAIASLAISINAQTACGVNTPSNNMEDAWGSFTASSLADDFQLAAKTKITTTSFTFDIAAPPGQTLTGLKISILDNNNGLPGALVKSYTLAPSSSAQVGFSNGLFFNKMTFDLPQSLVLENATNAVKTYWVSISEGVSNGTGYVEYSSASGANTTLYKMKSLNVNTAQWDNVGVEMVYSVVGNCETIGLSTNDINKSRVILSPNPVSDILNFNNAKKVENVEVYSIAGSKVANNLTVTNNTVDLSSLKPGVYVVSAVVDGVKTSSKITKN